MIPRFFLVFRGKRFCNFWRDFGGIWFDEFCAVGYKMGYTLAVTSHKKWATNSLLRQLIDGLVRGLRRDVDVSLCRCEFRVAHDLLYDGKLHAFLDGLGRRCVTAGIRV